MNSISILCVCLVGLIFSTLNIVNCQTVKERGVNPEDKRIILNKHNELRNLIRDGEVIGQPRGINLKKMKYDEALAKEAQKISDTCRFAHVIVKDKRWDNVGQNLYKHSSSSYKPGANWTEAIQKWFDEHEFYTYGRSINSDNGHYTQVIWAESEYVGCGYTLCNGKQLPYERIYTCNYGPAGNYMDQLPYKTE